MIKKIININILITSFIFSNPGLEIAKQIENRPQPKDMKSILEMNLINKKGKQRKSSLKSFIKDGGKKQIAWFLSPADDKGIGFLKIEHDKKDDEMRIYLPAFKKIRRISSKKKSDSFMGSDLSYEDLSNRNINDNTYNLLGNEVIDDQDYHILEIKPKKNTNSEYSKHIAWINKSNILPFKEDSYDKSNKLLKQKYFHFTKINDYYVIDTIKVFNVQKNHNTVLTFKDIKINSNINDNIFQEKNLKRLIN